MQRRFHYEQAFEHYLRANRVPYVAVDEAKKSLLPAGGAQQTIKSFDFLVSAPDRSLLVDIKGRRCAGRLREGRRLENWVTKEDIDGLSTWSRLFGDAFEPLFIFAYGCDQQPPDGLFEEVFPFGERWYGLREVSLRAYQQHMQPRSARWATVNIPAREFQRIARPFSLRDRPAAGCQGRMRQVPKGCPV